MCSIQKTTLNERPVLQMINFSQIFHLIHNTFFVSKLPQCLSILGISINSIYLVIFWNFETTQEGDGKMFRTLEKNNGGSSSFCNTRSINQLSCRLSFIIIIFWQVYTIFADFAVFFLLWLTIYFSIIFDSNPEIVYYTEEVKMYNKDNRTVIVFSLKLVWNNYLSVSYGKSRPRNGILAQNWYKDSIIDDIGVSYDDWDHHSSSRWRINV